MSTPHKKFKSLLLTPKGFKDKDLNLERYSTSLSEDTKRIINKFEFEVGKLYRTTPGPIQVRLVSFEEPFTYKTNVYKKELIKELYGTEDYSVKNKMNDSFTRKESLLPNIQFISIPKKTHLVFLESAIAFWESKESYVGMFYWCFLYGDIKIIYESTQFHSAYNTFFPV
jgi:hypothetical protein